MTIQAWLSAATERLRTSGSDSPTLDAELLLAHTLGLTRVQLLAEAVSPRTTGPAADELLARRCAGEPVAYLVGEREFFGLSFSVTPDVLIPRPESEVLIEAALTLLPPAAATTVVDLGTGSGCLAITLAVQRPRLRLIATDVSPAALAVAAGNARRHGVLARIGFRLGAGLGPLEREEASHLILANLPYLPSIDAAAPALHFEPRLALDGGPDGLDHYRELLAAITSRPQPPAHLLWEIDPRQTDAVRRLARDAGYRVHVSPDLTGQARVAWLTRV